MAQYKDPYVLPTDETKPWGCEAKPRAEEEQNTTGGLDVFCHQSGYCHLENEPSLGLFAVFFHYFACVLLGKGLKQV